MTRRTRIARLTLTAGLALSANAALGQTISWITPGDGKWEVASNWQGSNVPNSYSETAVFPPGGVYTVTGGVSNGVKISSLELLSPAVTLTMPGFGMQVGSGNVINEGLITITGSASQGPTIEFRANGALNGTGTVFLNSYTSSGNRAGLTHPTAAETTSVGAGQVIRGCGGLSGGTFRIDGSLRADLGGRIMYAKNVTLVGPGEFLADNGGIFQIFGGTWLSGITLTTRNGGYFYYFGAATSGQAYLVNVTNNGTFLLDHNTAMKVFDGNLTNNGLFVVNVNAAVGGSTLECSASGRIDGSGDILLNGVPGQIGSTSLSHPDSTVSTTIGAAQTIRGYGTLSSGTFIVDGRIAPGTASDSTQTIGTQNCSLVFTESARVEFEIGGAAAGDFDAITGNGTKTLGGTLAITALPAYAPAAHQEIVIMSATSIVGEFDAINYPIFTGTPMRFNLRYEPTRVVLYVPCPADFDADGFVNGDDFDQYIGVFEQGDPGADFNQDGFVSGDDFDAFVAAFEAGC